ncbi:MAG: hypothetical protein WD749_02965 [Phycisphaerales bacterium]
MRIPVRKIYRSFPDLDAFSDAECERFILQATSQRPWMLGWAVLVGAGLAALWLFVLIPLIVLAADAIGPKLTSDAALAISGITLTTLAVLGTLLPAMWVRDTLLIRTIRDRIALARCPFCGQSLLGLPLLANSERETVRCPECGRVVILEEIGLRHAELIPRAAAPDPSAAGG